MDHRVGMGIVALCGSLAGSPEIAHADSPDTAIRGVIDGVQRYDPSAAPLAKLGVWMLGPDGNEIIDRFDAAFVSPRENLGRPIVEIHWKLGTLTLVTDEARGFAWFQAPVSLSLEFPFGAACCDELPTSLRVSGIVVRTAKNQPWHLAALAFSRQLPDAALFRGATLEPATEATGDDDVGKQVAAWFPATGPTRLGKNAASKTSLVASGTAPKELATGAAASKLVAAWDKVGIRGDSVVATKTFAKDTIGLVELATRIPRKKKAAPMTLYAIVIRDGTAWKWVSLQWTTPLAKPPLEPVETNGSVNTFEHAP